jgi:PAS domain S-box-containing protein
MLEREQQQHMLRPDGGRSFETRAERPRGPAWAAKTTVAELRQRIQELVATVPVGYMLLDRRGAIRAVNASWLEMFGHREEEEVLGHDYAKFVPADCRSMVRDLLERLTQGERVSLASQHCCHNGALGHHTLHATPFFSAGEMAGADVFLTDHQSARDAEQKHTEEALRRAERLASVGTLAAGIAHEINNPLGAILLSAEAAILGRGRPNGEAILEASLANIQTSALRCGRIVKSVLQFARDEVSQKWPASISDVVRHARDMVRKLAAERGVTLRVELDENCPNLVMNPTEMEQVVMNLVSNAIQASSRGREVLVRIATLRRELRVTVEDHGRGMTNDEVAHMFDPFFTSRIHEGGTGLGLSIAHGIVQDHGGAIEVATKLGQGTSVTLVFPRELCKQEGASHG